LIDPFELICLNAKQLVWSSCFLLLTLGAWEVKVGLIVNMQIVQMSNVHYIFWKYDYVSSNVFMCGISAGSSTKTVNINYIKQTEIWDCFLLFERILGNHNHLLSLWTFSTKRQACY